MGLESGAPSIFTTASVCKLVAYMLICATDIQKLYSISKFPKPKYYSIHSEKLLFFTSPASTGSKLQPETFYRIKKNNLEDISSFCRATSFWISGDVCSGFQSQGGSLVCLFDHLSTRGSSDSFPV